ARRHIPTAADEISAKYLVPDPAERDQRPSMDLSYSYLGPDAFNRIDIASADSPSGESTSADTGEISWVATGRLPPGRCQQVNRFYKRHLLPGLELGEFVPTKLDTVFGANNPDHDEVMPVYGESDDEYDSETWEEIMEEREEKAVAARGL